MNTSFKSRSRSKNKSKKIISGQNVIVPLKSQHGNDEQQSFVSEIKNQQFQQENLIKELEDIKTVSMMVPKGQKIVDGPGHQSYTLGQNTQMKTNLKSNMVIQGKDSKVGQDLNKQIIENEEEQKIEDLTEEFDDGNLSRRNIEEVKNNPEDLKDIYNVFLQRTQLKYTDDPETILMIIALKKMINDFNSENQLLKRMNLELEKKEIEQKQMLKELSSNIQTMELEQRLRVDKPSEHVKFDLDDLDKRLLQMDDNLKKATSDNAQERFIQEIIEKNKEFQERSEENQGKMRKMKVDLTQLKTNLINLNNQ